MGPRFFAAIELRVPGGLPRRFVATFWLERVGAYDQFSSCLYSSAVETYHRVVEAEKWAGVERVVNTRPPSVTEVAAQFGNASVRSSLPTV